MRCWPGASGRSRPRRGVGRRGRRGPGYRAGWSFEEPVGLRRARSRLGARPTTSRKARAIRASSPPSHSRSSPLGQPGCAGRDEIGIQQAERLERDGRRLSAGAGGDDRGGIEDLEQAGDLGAALLEIDRAPGRARRRFVDGDLARAGPVGRDIRAAGAVVQLAGRGEHRVADRFGVEPSQRVAGEQAVVGIDPRGLRRGALDWR